MALKIRILRHPVSPLKLPKPVVATIGMFDGLHLGHQALLKTVVERRDKLSRPHGAAGSTMLISFYPHPDAVFGKKTCAQRLTTWHQKARRLTGLGIEYLVLFRFNLQLANRSAEDFINKTLIELLNVDYLVLGPDAALGRNREADAKAIQDCFSRCGRFAEIIPAVAHEGRRISSELIRGLILEGHLTQLPSVLGRRYALEGRTQRGAGRGTKLLFPTANLMVSKQLLPPFGVYATFTELGGRSFKSVTNIGRRPTFDGKQTVVETHLIGFKGGELYKRHIEIEIAAKIRDEIKFNNSLELSRQIKRDIQNASELLK